MTLGRCPLSIFCSRGTPPNLNLVLNREAHVREVEDHAAGGLVYKAHRLLYHSTLSLRSIKKKLKITLRTRAPVTTVTTVKAFKTVD